MALRARANRGWWTSVGPILLVTEPVAVLLATGLLAILPGTWPRLTDIGWEPVALAAGAALMVTLVSGRQRARLVLSLRGDLPALAVAAVTAAVVLVVASRVLTLDGDAGWVRGVVIVGLVFTVAAMIRATAYTVARLLRRGRRFSRATVLVGSGEAGRRVAAAILARPDTGLRPVGFVDCGRQLSPRGLPLPYLGGIEALPRVLADFEQPDVVVCLDQPPGDATADVVRECLSRPGRVFISGGHWPSWADCGRPEQVGLVSLARLHRWGDARHRRIDAGPSAPATRADEPEVHAGQLTG